MLAIETTKQSSFSTLTIQVDSPEGRMFVLFIEDATGKPLAIEIKVGKAGAHLQAWAMAMSRVITLCLDKGGTIEDILQELSGQRAEGGRTTGDGRVTITSGPEGIAYAIMQYRVGRFNATRRQLGIDDDNHAERKGRSGRVAR